MSSSWFSDVPFPSGLIFPSLIPIEEPTFWHYLVSPANCSTHIQSLEPKTGKKDISKQQTFEISPKVESSLLLLVHNNTVHSMLSQVEHLGLSIILDGL